MKYQFKCPQCKSARVYEEISIVAKRSLNTDKIFDINKNNVDNTFDDHAYCGKCGYIGDPTEFEL